MYTILIHDMLRDPAGNLLPPILASPREFPSGLDFLTLHTVPDRIAPLSFAVNTDLPLPDYLSIDTQAGAALCSQRLLDLFASEDAIGAAYPAQMYDNASGQLLKAPYVLWVPKRLDQAIDWEHCEVFTDDETGVRWMTTLALTPQVEAASPAIFRPSGRVEVLIHDQIRNRLAAAGITGVDFDPLDAVGMRGAGRELRDLERRLEQTPHDAQAWNDLGHLLWRLHHKERALAALDKAVALQPDLVDAWHTRGQVLQRLKRVDQALDAYRRAIAIRPSARILADYADALTMAGSYAEARVVAERALALNDRSPHAWYQLGRSQLALGHDGSAVDAFERAIAVMPGAQPGAFLGKGEALLRLGRYNEALAAFDHGLRFRSQNVALWQGKVQVLSALGKIEQAKQATQQADALEQERQANLLRLPL